jgi:hypothetical protein
MPQDLFGLTLTTTPAAADAYNEALGRVLRVRAGAVEAMQAAVAADPDFGLAHAGLALLGHEAGEVVDVRAALQAANLASRRCTARERSHIAAAQAWIQGNGRRAIEDHILGYPRDALMVSIAVPTIAFAGITDVPEEAWALVERLAPAYGTDWWYQGLLAFVRQEQSRWSEAAVLAERALDAESAAGHAAHARTHVFYETGDHADGLAWLDGWIDRSGLRGDHRAHFSWHAALHELAEADAVAVRHRYATQLAPPTVRGMRALVDSASLLWRGALDNVWREPVAIQPVLDNIDPLLLTRPPTAFAALHAAIALATADDHAGLRRLQKYAATAGNPALATVVAPLVEGFAAFIEQRYDHAANVLAPLLPHLIVLGGSAAQREVVEDTFLHALMGAGRLADARAVLARRLDRRPSRKDLQQFARIHRTSHRSLAVATVQTTKES